MEKNKQRPWGKMPHVRGGGTEGRQQQLTEKSQQKKKKKTVPMSKRATWGLKTETPEQKTLKKRHNSTLKGNRLGGKGDTIKKQKALSKAQM